MSRQPTPPQLLLENQLCFLFHRISRDLDAAYRPLLSELGLTYPQYLVMLVLWEQDGRSVGELGQQLCLDSGTLSPLLRRLESRGLLERRRDPDDERRVTLHLTRDGWALRRRARNIPESLGRKIVDDPAAYLQLHAQLTQIAERLEA
ncbi:MAG: MarR family transcriptional regulator [Actinobacteria bacterium]|nr:MarR family transcriptional regulator [Actinomycetota bacterium]MCB8997864.1 MarR family transcriptional regulator [Actinomycetota bacterium]MCB9423986.1 MarR family transcriptional regulator [Actinomycetota bacterium]